jgi:hypothetical protein
MALTSLGIHFSKASVIDQKSSLADRG